MGLPSGTALKIACMSVMLQHVHLQLSSTSVNARRNTTCQRLLQNPQSSVFGGVWCAEIPVNRAFRLYRFEDCLMVGYAAARAPATQQYERQRPPHPNLPTSASIVPTQPFSMGFGVP